MLACPALPARLMAKRCVRASTSCAGISRSIAVWSATPRNCVVLLALSTAHCVSARSVTAAGPPLPVTLTEKTNSSFPS